MCNFGRLLLKSLVRDVKKWDPFLISNLYVWIPKLNLKSSTGSIVYARNCMYSGHLFKTRKDTTRALIGWNLTSSTFNWSLVSWNHCFKLQKKLMAPLFTIKKEMQIFHCNLFHWHQYGRNLTFLQLVIRGSGH